MAVEVSAMVSITTLPCKVWRQGSGISKSMYFDPKHVTIWNQGRSNWVWHPGYFVILSNHKCFTHPHGCTCTWVMHTKQNWDENHQNILCCPSEIKCSYARTEQKARMLLYQELALNEDGWKGMKLNNHILHLRFKAFTQTLSRDCNFPRVLYQRSAKEKRMVCMKWLLFSNDVHVHLFHMLQKLRADRFIGVMDSSN